MKFRLSFLINSIHFKLSLVCPIFLQSSQGAKLKLKQYLFSFSILVWGWTAQANQSSLPKSKIDTQVNRIVKAMSNEQKIGQIILVSTFGWFEGNSQNQDVFIRWPSQTRMQALKDHCIGSVLSGGGGYPAKSYNQKGDAILPSSPIKNAKLWQDMIDQVQDFSCVVQVDGVEVKIPYLYGIDAVHGHNNFYGATIFPHNIALGAAFYQEALNSNEIVLLKKAAAITAKEMAATGVYWNYAPAVSIPQDIRWGRTYEGFSSNNRIVAHLGSEYMRGLQFGVSGLDTLDANHTVMATIKHYVGDGDTAWNSGEFELLKDTGVMGLDRGDSPAHKDLEYNLLPYKVAIEQGAQSIMVSYNSWNGTKMHENKELLGYLLSDEGLGFTGLVVSDWDASGGNPHDDKAIQKWITGINAGIDQVMISAMEGEGNPTDSHLIFLEKFIEAAKKGELKQEAIDRAATKVIRAKMNLGLFKRNSAIEEYQKKIGSAEHRAIAKQIVRKSQVLLTHKDGTLPINKTSSILVYGQAADDIGLQSGGWTLEWQGKSDQDHGKRLIPGTTILEGITSITGASKVTYQANEITTNENFPYGIAVITERYGLNQTPTTYAEYKGDRDSLNLSDIDLLQLKKIRARVDKLIVIIVSGRPIVLNSHPELFSIIDKADAIIASWYPGSEGAGVSENLFHIDGQGYTGHLPYPWPESVKPGSNGIGPALFEVGHGIETGMTR